MSKWCWKFEWGREGGDGGGWETLYLVIKVREGGDGGGWETLYLVIQMSEGGCGGRETLYVAFWASKGVVVGGKPSTLWYEWARGLWWVGNPLRRVLSKRGGCGGWETLYVTIWASEGGVVGGKHSMLRFEQARGLWWDRSIRLKDY